MYMEYVETHRDQINEDLKDFIEIEHEEENEDNGPTEDEMEKFRKSMGSGFDEDGMSKEQWDRDIAKELGYTYEEWSKQGDESDPAKADLGDLGQMFNQAGLGDLTAQMDKMPSAEDLRKMGDAVNQEKDL
jgi:hypothetical protein